MISYDPSIDHGTIKKLSHQQIPFDQELSGKAVHIGKLQVSRVAHESQTYIFLSWSIEPGWLEHVSGEIF